MTTGPEVPALAAWLAAWTDRRRDQLRPHTRKTDAMMVRNHVVPRLGERRLDELDRRLLERTYAHPGSTPGALELQDDPQVWTGEQAAAFLRAVDDHPWRALWHLPPGRTQTLQPASNVCSGRGDPGLVRVDRCRGARQQEAAERLAGPDPRS